MPNSSLPKFIQDKIEDSDGIMAGADKVRGTYFHSLFDSPNFRQAFLRSLKSDYKVPPDDPSDLIFQLRTANHTG